jgi:PAS domain S-box-containing protein
MFEITTSTVNLLLACIILLLIYFILVQRRYILAFKQMGKSIPNSREQTAEKKAHGELENSESIYEKMLATMNEGVIIYDNAGDIVKANERAAEILGIEFAELLKRKPLEVRMLAKDNHEDSFREISCPSTITYYEGKPVYNKIFSVKNSDTSSIWVLFNSLPIYKKDNQKPEYVILTITDISEQKKQELKLRDVNSQLNTLIENLNHGIMMGNKDKEIIYVNRFFQKLLGYETVGELINRKAYEIIEEKKNVIKKYGNVYEDIIHIVESNSVETKEILFEITSGKQIEIQYIPIINSEHYIGCIWKFEDVTKRK